MAVYGDYDCDGVTATALLTDYLAALGGQVIPILPHRQEEGYGLNCAALDRCKEQGITLLITVDNGISAIKEVDYANSLGMEVIVTDHHECRGILFLRLSPSLTLIWNGTALLFAAQDWR